jgi:hypothetical protein
MSYRIAIQPDHIVHKNGEQQSFSARWTDLASEYGHEPLAVDAFAPGFFDDVRSCHGLMWRFGYDALSLQFAKRVLASIEHGMRLPVFPSAATAWHFEDKVSQRYLLEAVGIAAPRTWVFWREAEALAFCRLAKYPLVAKLSAGIQSNNVVLLHNATAAADLVRRMFGPGVFSIQAGSKLRHVLRHRMPALRLLAGKPLPRALQHGYFYVQEFLPDNAFDTRVTVIGNRAFAFRRHNRAGDFRASGSGRIDWDITTIDQRFVRLAYKVARRLGTQSVAIDGLYREGEPVVGEISYTYASWAVRDCPGHWVLGGDPDTGPLGWVDGQLRPEDAIFDDFMQLMAANGRAADGDPA